MLRATTASVHHRTHCLALLNTGRLSRAHALAATSGRHRLCASRVVMAGLSGSAGAAAAEVRVATYNVLSPNLCSPGYFTGCDPEVLGAKIRLKGVLAQLEPEVEAGAVIGLQEVSLSWVGPLQVWLAKRGYSLLISNYGGYFNGFMGVGVAYPLAKYELLNADLCRLSDTKKWPRKPKEEDNLLGRAVEVVAPVGSWLWVPIRAIKNKVLGPPPKPEQDAWDYSARRFNSLVSLRLQCKSTGSTFWISTYHMPCAFFNPPVMVIHAALAVQRVSALASDDNDPYILCGDFNIKPGDASYNLVTTGEIPIDHPDQPEPRSWDPWRPQVSAAMKSVYKEVNGSEPDFTNFAKVRDQEPFIDCLDYIFCSKDCVPTSVRELKERGDVSGPFPTASEPSDHVLIAASITVLKTPPKPTESP